MNYIISYSPHHQHFIDIQIVIKTQEEKTRVQCPAWRPGRYEIGNFSGNVRGWKATNEKGENLPFRKITKDLWEVNTANCKELNVFYSYYAAELNAGSTYLDDRQLYMNPVNCCMYVPEGIEAIHGAYTVEIEVPANYIIATSLKKKSQIRDSQFTIHNYSAANYDELADSPILASPTLQSELLQVKNLGVKIWFQGEIKPDWNRIRKDFSIFMSEQISMMGGCPVKEYDFIFQALPYKFRHGVEHLSSTVIAIGPSYSQMKDEQYNSLLGISCHEFFHCWNIKSIRPVEMFPYDYTKENYSRLGYVYEGVTDYYGDYILFRTGIFNEQEYMKSMQQQLQKHFDNYGRYHLGIAESSFDTWLDGYTQGAPYRRVSIYTEGALLAFIVDMFIRKYTANTKSLDDVMRTLYHDYANQGKPYSENDYWSIIEQVARQSANSYRVIADSQTAELDKPLEEALYYVGLKMQAAPSEKHCERFWGMKIMEEDSKCKVAAVAPGSPAEKAGICIHDEITLINEHSIKNNFHEWCAYYGKEDVTLSLLSQSFRRYVTVKAENDTEFFPSYSIVKIPNANEEQKTSYKAWAKHKH